MINAVMLGAIAGCGVLPIPVDAFERAIRGEGKAADANLRGFKAGLAAARSEATALRRRRPQASAAKSRATTSPRSSARSATTMPSRAQEIVIEGVRRLTRFQDGALCEAYLDRLAPDPRSRRAMPAPAAS